MRCRQQTRCWRKAAGLAGLATPAARRATAREAAAARRGAARAAASSFHGQELDARMGACADEVQGETPCWRKAACLAAATAAARRAATAACELPRVQQQLQQLPASCYSGSSQLPWMAGVC